MARNPNEVYETVDALTKAQYDACLFADHWICFWMMAQQAAPADQKEKCAAEIEAWSRIKLTTYKTYQAMVNAALRGNYDFSKDTGGNSSGH